MPDPNTGASRRCRFGPLEVEYDDRVLVPRAWTLMQSLWAADLAAHAGPGPMLELCAGAGQIGLAAAVTAGRDLVQVEMDPVAAGYAVGNAERAGWAARTQVRVGSIGESVRPGEEFPLVIADPPYLATGDVGRFAEDPVLAIDGGADGLAVVRTCLAVAARHLRPGGALLLQVAGPAQAARVEELVSHGAAPGLGAVETRVVDDERAVMLLVMLPRRAG